MNWTVLKALNILNKIEKLLNKIDKLQTKQFEFINATLKEKITDENKIDLQFVIDESKKFMLIE